MENMHQLVPFLRVSDLERSVRFWVQGIGFTMRHRWEPEGKLRWCWLTLGSTALMLQMGAPADGGGGGDDADGVGTAAAGLSADGLRRRRKHHSMGPDKELPASIIASGEWANIGAEARLRDSKRFKAGFLRQFSRRSDPKLIRIVI